MLCTTGNGDQHSCTPLSSRILMNVQCTWGPSACTPCGVPVLNVVELKWMPFLSAQRLACMCVPCAIDDCRRRRTQGMSW